MALELLVRNTDFYVYRGCASNWVPFPPGAETGYGGFCGTGKAYYESIVIADSFVYDAAIDRYRLVTWNNIANWPSWDISTSVIHPETGVEESRIPLAGYAVAHAWTDPVYNAGLNKMVAGYIAIGSYVVDPVGGESYGIVDVTMPDGLPTAAQLGRPYVTNVQIPDLAGTNMGHSLCPERKLITYATLMYGNRIVTYDYSPYPSAAIYKWEQPLPESFCWSMGYEDDQRCWSLCSGGVFGAGVDPRQTLMKYNFATNRVELLTELQTAGGADRMTLVAFDTKRKKLAAVRIKADGGDGKHNNAFEIYAPRIAATKVTVPVNLTTISDEARVPFISHVLGTKGEAGASREVTISCAPTAALVRTPKMVTGLSGSVEFMLEPHVAGASEAVTVSHVDNKVL